MGQMNIHPKFISLVQGLVQNATSIIHVNAFNKMEKTCRQFLWESNQDGKPKMPLLAWEQLQKSKMADGLDIKPFMETCKALKLKLCYRIFSNADEDWGWFQQRDIGNLMKALKMLEIDCIGEWSNEAIPDSLPRPITRFQARVLEESDRIFPASKNIDQADWSWNVWGKSCKGWELSTKFCRNVTSAPNRDMYRFQRHWQT
ncbi:hypothetical protein R1sor_003777 [Riccia sorocarpa]|uniref:Uncharacterized protein n=1 Tax=Riccia sorocarpa TaxID=122646 RepID=A0ABD3H2L3_9MARC